MTDADKYFMVDVDDRYLNAFLRWYDQAREAGKLDSFTTYAVLKMAFSAGRNSQPDEPYAPSRDVLPPAPAPRPVVAPPQDRRAEIARRYAPPQPWQRPQRPSTDTMERLVGTMPGHGEPGYDGLRPMGRQQAAYGPPLPPPMRGMPVNSDQIPDPFAQVRLSGPQQAAMEGFFGPDQARENVWDARVPETRAQPVFSLAPERAEGYDPARLKVTGELEALPDEHPVYRQWAPGGDRG